LIDRFIEFFIKKILRVRSFRDDPNWEPVKADPPPWDVPLDQTEAPIHYEGDRSSV
jgi:hypothetical protein